MRAKVPTRQLTSQAVGAIGLAARSHRRRADDRHPHSSSPIAVKARWPIRSAMKRRPTASCPPPVSRRSPEHGDLKAARPPPGAGQNVAANCPGGGSPCPTIEVDSSICWFVQANHRDQGGFPRSTSSPIGFTARAVPGQVRPAGYERLVFARVLVSHSHPISHAARRPQDSDGGEPRAMDFD